MKNNLFPIAKEGVRYIVISLLLFILFAILDLDLFEFIAGLFFLFFLYIFRNPERVFPIYGKGSVVSPVDGKVISIKEIEDKYYMYKIEIESDYRDVSLLRVPFNSRIQYIKSYKGSRLSKNSPLYEKLNENSTVVFTDEKSNKIQITHRLKRSLVNLEINAKNKKDYFQGHRYGLMVDGVTTIYFPRNFRLDISVGDHLLASEILLGYFS
jgi:phosphatidylserine decarboxylase